MNFGIMEEIYFCGKDLNRISTLMRNRNFVLSREFPFCVGRATEQLVALHRGFDGLAGQHCWVAP